MRHQAYREAASWSTALAVHTFWLTFRGAPSRLPMSARQKDRRQGAGLSLLLILDICSTNVPLGFLGFNYEVLAAVDRPALVPQEGCVLRKYFARVGPGVYSPWEPLPVL